MAGSAARKAATKANKGKVDQLRRSDKNTILHQVEGNKPMSRKVIDEGYGEAVQTGNYDPDAVDSSRNKAKVKKKAREKLSPLPDAEETKRLARKTQAKRRSSRTGRKATILSKYETLG